MDVPPVFWSSAERPVLKGYGKLLAYRQGTHRITDVNEKSLQIVWYGRGNLVIIPQATLSRTSRRYCDEKQTGKEEGFSKRESESEKESYKGYEFTDSTHVVDTNLR